jgi:hypothetical protein
MNKNLSAWKTVNPKGMLPTGIIMASLVIVSLFFITKNDIPTSAELTYSDISTVNTVAGSVVPASCDSSDWRGSFCAGVSDMSHCHDPSKPKYSFCPTDNLSCEYFSSVIGTYAHSGSHVNGDCKTTCPGGLGTYDPYYDPEASACPNNLIVVFAKNCPLPWGGSIPSGASVNAYQASSASYCLSETRTCTDGTLDGSYTYSSCRRTSTGSSGGGCFVAGTKVTLADGTHKDIEDVLATDMLLSSNGPVAIEQRLRIAYEGDVYAFNGDGNYFVTPSHPFMTTEGWKSIDPVKTRKEMPGFQVAKLEVGDTLILEDGQTMTLTGMDSKYEKTTVYNFQLDGTHEYYADKFLVHNKVAL